MYYESVGGMCNHGVTFVDSNGMFFSLIYVGGMVLILYNILR